MTGTDQRSSKRAYTMGRRGRSVAETRGRIIDAALDLFDPRTSLAAIGARAGVSERTVLRHFGSRAGLVAAAIEAGNARVRAKRFEFPSGDVQAAAANLVSHYEEWGERVLTRLAEEGRDPNLDEILAAGRQLHRAWVREKLGPLLGELPRRERRRRIAQLVAVCDVYTWKLLRRDSGLSAAETERAIAELIRAITDHEERR